MNIFQKAKHWIMGNLSEEGPDKQPPGKVPPVPSLSESGFIRFYRNIALEILADIDYEKDFTYTLHASSAVIQRFKPQKYADKISLYFREKGVYKKSPYDGLVMQLLLVIIAPPMDAEIQLNREIRIHLFNSVLKDLSKGTKENLPALIRAMYDKVRFGGTNLHGIEQSEILDLLRGSAGQFEVELKTTGVRPDKDFEAEDARQADDFSRPERQKQPKQPKGTKGPEQAEQDDHAAGALPDKTLAADLLHVLNVRSRKDFQRLFKKFSSLEFWITSLLELGLLTLLIVFKEHLTAALDTGVENGPEIVTITLNSVTMLMILHLFIRTLQYSAAAARRKQLRQLFSGLEKREYFSRNDAESTIKLLFGDEKLFY